MSQVRDALAAVFADPPTEYGPIDGYWWEAGRLDRDRLRWQLEELKDKGVCGTWFYARYHDGEALGSDPAYFSDGWWEFTRFAAEEQRRLGLINWFSNWTALAFEQGEIREARAEEPDLWGRRLLCIEAESQDGPVEIELAEHDQLLDVAAYRRTADGLDYASRQVLPSPDGRTVRWVAPSSGWLVAAVVARRWDLDYLNPEIGRRWNSVVLGEYERKLGPLLGSNGVGAFGPDEMALFDGVTMFSPLVLDRFGDRYGYDPSPLLAGIFYDIGPSTEQIRSAYREAMMSVLDENFYQATPQWLHQREMKYVSLSQMNENAVEHTFHYGDFFRYMRTFDVPGNEDPFTAPPGQRRLFRTKISSSVAHLYQRERAVVCAHYASGWGHTLGENLAWTLESYAKGLNLYNRHLISYSLMGGWYEYVPPSDHFYQPAWRYWKHFADFVRRLSYVMSQGQHRADVAVLYPMATIHADWLERPVAAGAVAEPEGDQAALESVDEDMTKHFGPAALEASEQLERLSEAIYHNGIDFDFIDDESLDRADVSGGVLSVAGVELRSLVLPPMTTVSRQTMSKIAEFHDAGGAVIACGRLPVASVEGGRDDPELDALIDRVFHDAGAHGVLVDEPAGVPKLVSAAIDLDVVTSGQGVFHTHQRHGDVDIYLLFNVEDDERDLTFDVRAVGRPELWDPHTGEIHPVHRVRHRDGRTEVRLRLRPYEGAVLVIGGAPDDLPAVIADDLAEVTAVTTGDTGPIIDGFADSGGSKYATVVDDGLQHQLTGHAADPPDPIPITGPFTFVAEPTMDNRWGDFRYPASPQLIGTEVRRFRYREEDGTLGVQLGWHDRCDDADWPDVAYSYGPYWLHLGPFLDGTEPADLAERAARGDRTLDWQPYRFSQQFGPERRVQREGFSGWFQHLLGIPQNFLVLDDVAEGTTTEDHVHYLYSTVHATSAGTYHLEIGHVPGQPEVTGLSLEEGLPYQVPAGTQAWVNSEPMITDVPKGARKVTATVPLAEGPNPVLVRIVHPAGGYLADYAVLLTNDPGEPDQRIPLLHWYRDASPLILDVKPHDGVSIGWYRFEAPPGLRRMTVAADAEEVEAWVDGSQVEVRDGVAELPAARPGVALVALRVRHRRGAYGGAAFTAPVGLECGEGKIELGDWTGRGLAHYSGIGVYRTELTVPSDRIGCRALLDLGEVHSVAEVLVNDRSAEVRLARPFTVDVTDLIRPGTNQLVIKVANTLANHMSSYPSKWVFDGQTRSGLVGPVTLHFRTPVRLS